MVYHGPGKVGEKINKPLGHIPGYALGMPLVQGKLGRKKISHKGVNKGVCLGPEKV